MDGQRPTRSSLGRRSSQGLETNVIKDDKHLSQDMVCDPWPVTKSLGRKDTVLEAARKLVRARNIEIVNGCTNAITLLPASGAIVGVQGGSPERHLYSLSSPKVEPFKVHLWQTPPVRTWDRIKLSWNVTPGRIMVRRGLNTEPLTLFLKSLGVSKGEAKIGDLCKHFHCWRSLNAREGWLDEYPQHLRGEAYQRWWSFNGFRFLELPPELREMILIFAMGDITVPFTRYWPPACIFRFSNPNMRLALVSKQLNREVTATLFAHTTFYFHSIQQLLRTFSHGDEKTCYYSQRFKLKDLRSVELDLSPDDLLRLFGVSFAFGSQETRYQQSSAFDMGSIFDGDPPPCRRICIKIQHVFKNNPRPNHTSCQKSHTSAFWAGARARLRNIAEVELVGHIDETQKNEWLAEHALQRKGIVPEAKDFAGWQRVFGTQW